MRDLFQPGNSSMQWLKLMKVSLGSDVNSWTASHLKENVNVSFNNQFRFYLNGIKSHS